MVTSKIKTFFDRFIYANVYGKLVSVKANDISRLINHEFRYSNVIYTSFVKQNEFLPEFSNGKKKNVIFIAYFSNIQKSDLNSYVPYLIQYEW